MTYALIDNASLTSVQRAMGEVEVKNRDTINGDLVALENMVQSILFYDELICIDNYKEQFVEERAARFDFVRFINPKEFNLEDIEVLAKAEANSIKPEIRGGEFADDDFKSFVELLKMNIVCTWDLASSVYYLTMKMLGQPYTEEWAKYGALSASIYSELSDVLETYGRWSEEVSLIGSDGTVHTEQMMKQAREEKSRGCGGTTRALDMFVASLNWLAYKTIYYSLAAKYFKADSFLHPIRHAFQMHWMEKAGVYGHDFTSKLVGTLSDSAKTTISEIADYGRSSTVCLDIPIFSAWLGVETGGPNGVIQAAHEIKSNQEFQDIRGLLKQIRVAYDEEGIGASNKLISKWELELSKASQAVKNTYGIDTGQGIPSSFIMNIYNSVAAVSGLPKFPTFNFRVPLPEFISNNRSSSFTNIYKDMTRELTTIERMGGLRDLLASSFRVEGGGYYSGRKTEDPRYRNYSSDWKLKM